MQETQVQSLGQEDPLEKGMATHSIILAWRIPWTEAPGTAAREGTDLKETWKHLGELEWPVQICSALEFFVSAAGFLGCWQGGWADGSKHSGRPGSDSS